MIRIDQEKDIEVLRQVAGLLERENQLLTQKIVALTKEILQLKGQDTTALQLQLELLQQQLAKRNQMLFGDSSEKRPTEEKKPKKKKEQQKGHGPTPQPKLPIQEVIHPLDKDEQTCAKCGGELQEWPGQFEESEEIDVVHRYFVIKKHKRQKYRCGCQSCVETAPGPEKLAPGSRYSIDFAIEVATEKYLEHMPLERQVRKMEREGLDVTSQTLWDQLNVLAHHLKPTADALHKKLVEEPVLGIDETRWRLMSPKGQDIGELEKWDMFAVCGPKAVYYKMKDHRNENAAKEMLPGYEGVIMADGLNIYETVVKNNPKILLANCWSHTRRNFVELEKIEPKAAHAVNLIQKLYKIEAQAKEEKWSEAKHLEVRKDESKKIMEELKGWALKQVVLPESAFAKALRYMLERWAGLTLCLENVKIPLDNNSTERALRGPVVGRKNHYGSRSKRGMEVAALFYTLLESAKLCEIDPKKYMREATLAAIKGKPVLLPKDAEKKEPTQPEKAEKPDSS